MASASNLLKFFEKIALQKQCQAEETVVFEEVMMDFGSIQLQAQKLGLAYTRSSHYSGSLPNVNQVGCGLAEFQGPFHSPLDSSWSTRHHGLVEQNVTHCSHYGSGPNIILTGDASPGFYKEIAAALA
ncbi:hypothetical protein E5288_WYG002353 [Bos mutus]|uniref:Transducer of regulated CREB activity N-terminal domain-containing protein n=1 Tax=Bos mutus TaxID=72004 RepID=A0A6B0R7F0_9CETA|nr:hypothetical protein [Bos mutus]